MCRLELLYAESINFVSLIGGRERERKCESFNQLSYKVSFTFYEVVGRLTSAKWISKFHKVKEETIHHEKYKVGECTRERVNRSITTSVE